MAQKLRDAKIIDPRSTLYLSQRNDAVVVSCTRNPNATETDEKINAILIAKTIFDFDANTTAVTVNFNLPPGHESWTVTVKRSLVLDFNSGDVSQKAVLNLITVNKHLSFGPPMAGSYLPERKLFYDVLCELESKRFPDTTFVDQYRAVEEALNKNDSAAVELKFYTLRPLIAAVVRAYNVEVFKQRPEIHSEIKNLFADKPASAGSASSAGTVSGASTTTVPAAPNAPSTASTAATSSQDLLAQLGDSAPPPGAMFESRCKATLWIKQATKFGFIASPELLLALSKANDLARSGAPKSKTDPLTDVSKFWRLDFPFLPSLRL
jgi:hypothetical protein